MILDHFDNLTRYLPLHPGFERAARFLAANDLASLPDGRQEIDGDRVYALIMRREGKGRDAAKLETHDRYIDIQCTLAGLEVIGWEARRQCASRSTGYDAAKDIEFFPGKPAAWVTVPPAHFAIFFPEDAHAPLAADEKIHKVVLKILVKPD